MCFIVFLSQSTARNQIPQKDLLLKRRLRRNMAQPQFSMTAGDGQLARFQGRDLDNVDPSEGMVVDGKYMGIAGIFTHGEGWKISIEHGGFSMIFTQSSIENVRIFNCNI